MYAKLLVPGGDETLTQLELEAAIKCKDLHLTDSLR